MLPTNNKSSLFKNPSKLTLPSKIAFPVNNDDKQFLENFSYLPVSQTKGIALFNAFVNYCNNSEQHAVLVSRAFVSSNIRLHGERVAIRQVQLIVLFYALQFLTLWIINKLSALFYVLVLSWVFSERHALWGSSGLSGSSHATGTQNGGTLLNSYVWKGTLQVCTLHKISYLSVRRSISYKWTCLPLLLAGARVKQFDRSPKGYVNLSPGFWSIALWKSTIFMHHNIDVLQQVH